MYTEATPPASGSGVEVTPDRLDQQAGHFASLSEELRRQIAAGDVQAPLLGTAPPALWLAERLARLAGRGGVSGALLEWSDGLACLSENERATASDYRGCDDHNAVTFKGINTDAIRDIRTAGYRIDPASLNLPADMQREGEQR